MSVPVEGAVRPPRIKHGDMWWESIDTILTKHSIDGASPDGGWERLLEDKRNDEHYEEVRLSIEERGFVRPLTCMVRDGGQDFSFGDGHHRLAAAIELGLTMVPLQAFDEEVSSRYYGGAVADDSGCWTSFDDPIPEENNISTEDEYEEDWTLDEEDFEDEDEFCCSQCNSMSRSQWERRNDPEPEPVVEACTCYFCRNMK